MSFGGGDLDNAHQIQGGTDQTIIGNVGDRLKVNLPIGQQNSANSTPVVIASDQTIQINLTSENRQTFTASALFTMAASATDVFTISGSATKTIKIYRIYYVMTATAGANATVRLIRRSSLNTGGTSVLVTSIAHDTNNAAATAVIRSYTANPTLGTTVGDLRIQNLYISGGGTIGAGPFIYESITQDQPLVLRGTSQLIAINMNAATFAGNVCRAWVEFTEE